MAFTPTTAVFINYTVAGMLNKFLVRQARSRPRRSNDNGLVEAKNGVVIRKHIGYGHIESSNADDLMRFYHEHFNPYVNYHRPSGVPGTVTDKKAKCGGCIADTQHRMSSCGKHLIRDDG